MKFFFSKLDKTDSALFVYLLEVLADRLHSLEKDHMDILNQLHKYVNILSNVKLRSLLHTQLVNQLAQDNQPHPVIAFKPKQLSIDSTPEEFAIWKENFEVYFTAINEHKCQKTFQY